jgi:hypothetical protein
MDTVDLWTFPINIISPLVILIPLLNPTDFMVPVIALACYLYFFII